ncbi:hypothetical protein KO465_02580 [Candidatus Micrarchaeota archaeon]|nr:hypothetical protein [Candidatus Micrarchaeota archaeon]
MSLFKPHPKPPFKVSVKDSNKDFFRRFDNGELQNNLMRIISWENIEGLTFVKGRSGYISLHPFSESSDGLCLQIKGLGDFNNPNIMNLPGHGVFLASNFHNLVSSRVDEKGKIIFERYPAEPMGGLRSSKAQREYMIAKYALETRLPTEIPVMWGEYDDLTFNGEKLAFVAVLKPSSHDFRVDDILLVKEDLKNGTIILSSLLTEKLNVEEGKFVESYKYLNWFSSLVFDLGKSLREFHNNGVYHLQCNPNNTYCPANLPLHIYDLDGCFLGNELNTQQRITYQLIDLVNGLSGISQSIIISFPFLYQTLENNRLRTNPYISFLKGYFGPKYFKKIKGSVPVNDFVKLCSVRFPQIIEEAIDSFDSFKSFFDILITESNILGYKFSEIIEQMNQKIVKIKVPNFEARA